MSVSRSKFFCTAVLCSVFLLGACSSHDKTVVGPDALSQGAVVMGKQSVWPSEDVEDIEEDLADMERSAQEEIAALEKMGHWGEPVSIADAVIKGKSYDFPVVHNRQVQFYLDLFQGKQRESFGRWLARSSKYVPTLEKELAKAGLPRDLAYLAMIESGYNPSAVSRVGAGGLWQFMPRTGRAFNLTINSWVDERREPEKATKAAIRYLTKLYRMFGDWHLAVAAYNTGEGNIQNAMRRHGLNNFWQLAEAGALYTETKFYVPKLIAAIIIARNPAAYGFRNISYQKAPRYEVVQVPGGTDLNAVAEITGTSLKHLRGLNNELLRNRTPPQDRYALRVPVGGRALIAANLKRVQERQAELAAARQAATPSADGAYMVHVVQEGETLHAVSRRYQVSLTELLRANRLHVSQLQTGQRLNIPASGAEGAAFAAVARSGDRVKTALASVERPRKAESRKESRTESRKKVARERSERHERRVADRKGAPKRETRGEARTVAQKKSGHDARHRVKESRNERRVAVTLKAKGKPALVAEAKRAERSAKQAKVAAKPIKALPGKLVAGGKSGKRRL